MPIWTYPVLKSADTLLGIVDMSSAVASLNAQTTVLPPQDILWSAIRDVLMNNFDWGTLVTCANLTPGLNITTPGGGLQSNAIQQAAIAIRECCLWGGVFQASNNTFWNKLVAAANQLTPATVGGISSASANAVVALRTPTVPTWQPPVTVGDVQTARAQP